MSARRLLLPALALLAVAVNARLGATHRPAPAPSTIAGALARLEEQGQTYHVYLQSTDVEGGVFLTTRPRDPAELRLLQRTPEDAPRWKGVVLAKRELHPDDVFFRQVEAWDGAACWRPPLVLFGDPEMVARIAAAL